MADWLADVVGLLLGLAPGLGDVAAAAAPDRRAALHPGPAGSLTA